jgi:hypothetical protein
MTNIREICREATSAISIASFIEGGLIALFLAGVLVAFALSVAP